MSHYIFKPTEVSWLEQALQYLDEVDEIEELLQKNRDLSERHQLRMEIVRRRDESKRLLKSAVESIQDEKNRQTDEEIAALADALGGNFEQSYVRDQ